MRSFKNDLNIIVHIVKNWWFLIVTSLLKLLGISSVDNWKLGLNLIIFSLFRSATYLATLKFRTVVSPATTTVWKSLRSSPGLTTPWRVGSAAPSCLWQRRRFMFAPGCSLIVPGASSIWRHRYSRLCILLVRFQ